jgi:hypothetical protein
VARSSFSAVRLPGFDTSSCGSKSKVNKAGKPHNRPKEFNNRELNTFPGGLVKVREKRVKVFIKCLFPPVFLERFD